MPNTKIEAVCQFMDQFAPRRLAEEWDNVGLLVGDANAEAQRVMTCLTITPRSAEEAVRRQANLVITHHPLPFRPLKRLTTDTTAGRLLLDLIRANIAVYSPHTAFDSAGAGINQRLAEGFGLDRIRPLVVETDQPQDEGSGRYGDLPHPHRAGDVVQRVKAFLQIDHVQLIGSLDRQITRIAIACGSGGSFLAAGQRHGCELFVTGEASFHTCLEAEATGTALLLTGHFASERFAVEQLAQLLTAEFDQVDFWASAAESDPIQWL